MSILNEKYFDMLKKTGIKIDWVEGSKDFNNHNTTEKAQNG